MGKDVIIACDFSSKEQTLAFLERFTGRKPFHTGGYHDIIRNGFPACAFARPGDGKDPHGTKSETG